MKQSKVENIKEAFQRGLLMERMGYSVEASKKMGKAKSGFTRTKDPEKKQKVSETLSVLEDTPTLISCAEALDIGEKAASTAWWFYQAVQSNPSQWLRYALRYGIGDVAQNFKNSAWHNVRKTSTSLEMVIGLLKTIEVEETYEVYFIEGANLIKIGCAKSAQKRLNGLQKCSPVTLKLVGCIKGGKSREHELHERFHEFRHHGEWFVNIRELRTFISGLNPDVRAADRFKGR